MYSAPSNLSPASEEYAELVRERVEKLRAANITVKAVTANFDRLNLSKATEIIIPINSTPSRSINQLV